jgi:site-specific DNA-methyltransferase (adenine-specific)
MADHEQPVEGSAAAEWVAIERLTPWVKNPRKNDATVDRAAASIKAHGWGAPILARRDNSEIIAGHTRLKAALRMGLRLVPVRYLDLDEIRAHSLALADNRVGEESEWDREALARVLDDLQRAGADLEATGFDEKEVDDLIAKLEAERLAEIGEDLDDDLLALPAEPKSEAGRVYALGPHRLLCGDSRDIGAVEAASDGRRVDLVWTDPPYNVGYVGKTKDALTIENDKMEDGAFRDFLRDAFSTAAALMRPGAIFYIAHADSEGLNFRGAVRDVGWKLAQTIIWVKDVFVMGRQDYQWRHEPILYGWRDDGAHLVLKDRTQDTIWEIPRPKVSAAHPTMKPVALVRRAIVNSSRIGDLVLDLFGGSGTTMVACAKEQRSALLVELDPKYCDVIRRRWARFALKAGLDVGDGLVGEQVDATATPPRRVQAPALPAPIETGGPPSRLPN